MTDDSWCRDSQEFVIWVISMAHDAERSAQCPCGGEVGDVDMTDSPGQTTGNSDLAGGASPAMTPEAALARHVEWLEFALAAAKSEATWRASRLEKATKKNLAKRTARLG
ncbi:MAG TPA: hypothetical protein VFR93_11480, partial [Candidatus Limnocylindrales bacterium]|nr:hypothetical protein [Candidatus Limnocylindrales bacterium]